MDAGGSVAFGWDGADPWRDFHGISAGHRKIGDLAGAGRSIHRGAKFKIDIPLLPGDSGGPVVNAVGSLVGINSAVEFLVPLETAFFVDSEGSRPNTRMIEKLIRADRAQKWPLSGFEKNRSHSARLSAISRAMLSRKNGWWIAMGCGLLMTGCRSISDEWTSRKDAVSAHNQMMLVRQNPETLGYRRLMVKSQESADLKIFIGQTGVPDFLAEATSGIGSI